MSKIRAVTTLLIDIPLQRPHLMAMAEMRVQTSALVAVLREDGHWGIGEASTILGASYVPESPETIKTLIDTHIAPILEGRCGDRPAARMAELGAHVKGNHFAKCAVETALWDAYAKSCALPVSAFFGGGKHTSLPVLWTLASGELDVDIAEGEALLERKLHNDFKVKIGRKALEEDCSHVAKLAAHFQGRASIRVDVNQHWNRSEAARGGALLGDAGVALMEQPLHAADLDGMAALCAASAPAIMADESITGPKSMFTICAAQAADAVSLKIAQAGGLSACKAMASIAQAGHMDVYGGTMLEGPIGTAASAHVFSGIDHFAWGTELFGPLLQRENILLEPLTYADFTLKVPEGPGLGIHLNWGKISHLMREGCALPDLPDIEKEAVHAVHG